jgi:streptogramin lyase
MRVLIGFIIICTLSSGTLPAGTLPTQADEKAKKGAKGKVAVVAGPKNGVKTPGVLIPFADLKAEAEIPEADKPSWIFFSASVFVPAKDHIEKIDLRSNKPGDPVKDVKQPCGGMVSAFNSLWVPDCATGSLLRLDSKTFKVSATIPAGTSARKGTIAASGDSVWLLTDDKTTISRIDPDQNAVVGEFRVYPDCGNLTFGETALWLTCPSENKIIRINPATSLVEKTIEVSARPEAIAIGETSVWVLCGKDGKIDRIDPKTNKVSKTIDLAVPDIQGGLAIGDGAVWVTATGFPLTRIDPVTETVAQQFWGEGGGAIQFTAGQTSAIWLSNLNNGTLWRIDPKRVLATLAE